ncbi:MAG: hypothetical protein J4F47_08320 [Alphaproteobacteria bacterium]|nr:hypothetical protein [Alphaproteobacteria bacterium]
MRPAGRLGILTSALSGSFHPALTARTVDTLWAAIGALLESFEPNECANYFRHAGYGST